MLDVFNHRIKEPVIVLSDSEANSGDEETRYCVKTSSTLDVIAFNKLHVTRYSATKFVAMLQAHKSL